MRRAEGLKVRSGRNIGGLNASWRRGLGRQAALAKKGERLYRARWR